MNGALAVGKAVAEMATNNLNSETCAAITALSMLPTNLDLVENWTKTLDQDAQKRWASSIESAVDPSAIPLAAKDAATYSQDQNKMNSETAVQTGIIQNEKLIVAQETNCMQGVYEIEEPVASELTKVTKLIASFGA